MNCPQFFISFLLLPRLALADTAPIGFLQVPPAAKVNVQRVGTPLPVVVGNKQGEVWYQEESYARVVRKFNVYTEATASSEKLASIDISGAWMEIVAEAAPGSVLGSDADSPERESGMRRLLVFEKKESWVRIRFRDQPPWNGRFGWILLENATGGFVSLR